MQDFLLRPQAYKIVPFQNDVTTHLVVRWLRSLKVKTSLGPLCFSIISPLFSISR